VFIMSLGKPFLPGHTVPQARIFSFAKSVKRSGLRTPVLQKKVESLPLKSFQ